MNLDATRETMKVGVRRASSFMALGLKIAADDSVTSVTLDSNFQYHFMPEPLTPEISAEVRSSFAGWIIGNALRELEQHFSIFLDQVYASLLLMEGGGKATPDFEKRWSTFADKTSISSKLDALEAEFAIKASYRDHMDTIRLVRNAFGHHLGRVGRKQCNEKDALRLRWRGMDMVFGPHVISGPFEPAHVEQGQQVVIRPVDRERRFALGEPIELTPHDLSEICLMFNVQADELIGLVLAYAEATGIPVVKLKWPPPEGADPGPPGSTN